MSTASVSSTVRELFALFVIGLMATFSSGYAYADVTDFTGPYGKVVTVAGERPLLVILLQPPDTRMRSDINMYALREDGSILQTSFSQTTGWWVTSQLPTTHLFTSAPAVLDSPDGQVQSVFALAEDGYIYQTFASRFWQAKPWKGWAPRCPRHDASRRLRRS